MTNTERQNGLRVDTESSTWEPAAPRLERTRLAPGAALDEHETSIYRVASGARLESLGAGEDLEIVVVNGDLSLGDFDLGAGDYARRPGRGSPALSTQNGCLLFVKAGPFLAGDAQPLALRTGDSPWQAGHGNLQVKSLHSREGQHTALVRWPAGERFVPHQHFGGEEILVLSGVFEDEHGRYPTGTWLQSPHRSSHHPFVREETVIFVKTGHLPMAQE